MCILSTSTLFLLPDQFKFDYVFVVVAAASYLNDDCLLDAIKLVRS